MFAPYLPPVVLSLRYRQRRTIAVLTDSLSVFSRAVFVNFEVQQTAVADDVVVNVRMRNEV